MQILYYIAISFLLLSFPCFSLFSETISIPKEEILEIGEKIYKNECGSNIKNLAIWHKGKENVELGIGHFIWYPKKHNEQFYEWFPKYLHFLKYKDVAYPLWITSPDMPCPWNTREEFYNAQDSVEMISLIEFLKNTKYEQTLFIIETSKYSICKILKTIPDQNMQAHVLKQYNRVIHSKNGTYAIADYIDFKGEGILETEKYKGEGWGLLQVLELMKGENKGPEALKEFSECANYVLKRRVENSQKEKNEIRWLKGWENRTKTYCSDI